MADQVEGTHDADIDKEGRGKKVVDVDKEGDREETDVGKKGDDNDGGGDTDKGTAGISGGASEAQPVEKKGRGRPPIKKPFAKPQGDIGHYFRKDGQRQNIEKAAFAKSKKIGRSPVKPGVTTRSRSVPPKQGPRNTSDSARSRKQAEEAEEEVRGKIDAETVERGELAKEAEEEVRGKIVAETVERGDLGKEAEVCGGGNKEDEVRVGLDREAEDLRQRLKGLAGEFEVAGDPDSAANPVAAAGDTGKNKVDSEGGPTQENGEKMWVNELAASSDKWMEMWVRHLEEKMKGMWRQDLRSCREDLEREIKKCRCVECDVLRCRESMGIRSGASERRQQAQEGLLERKMQVENEKLKGEIKEREAEIQGLRAELEKMELERRLMGKRIEQLEGSGKQGERSQAQVNGGSTAEMIRSETQDVSMISEGSFVQSDQNNNTTSVAEKWSSVVRRSRGGPVASGRVSVGAIPKPLPLPKREIEWELKERFARRKNVVVRGVRAVGRGLQQEVAGIISERLGVNAKIVQLQQVAGGPVVTLSSMETKKRILDKKAELKGSGIWIGNDYTRREKEVQEWLQSEAKKEERRGKITRLGYMKMMVNGVWKKWNEESGELEKITFRGR